MKFICGALIYQEAQDKEGVTPRKQPLRVTCSYGLSFFLQSGKQHEMRKGSLTSKSLGDLPEFQEDSRIKKKPAAAGWSEDFDDHWTDNAGPSRPNKDDDDEEYLPEPETKTSRSFNLFGSKKGVVTAEGERLRGTRYGAVDGKTPTIEEDLDDSAFASPNTRR